MLLLLDVQHRLQAGLICCPCFLVNNLAILEDQQAGKRFDVIPCRQLPVFIEVHFHDLGVGSLLGKFFQDPVTALARAKELEIYRLG